MNIADEARAYAQNEEMVDQHFTDAGKIINRCVERIEDLEELIQRINQWCEAYPTTVFGPPNKAEVENAINILNERGVRISGLYAEWGRHILNAIQLMIMEAPK